MRAKLTKLFYYSFIVVSFVLLLYRITLHADTHDEIINLNISYRYALGDIPFYHCWDAYQGGDIFLAPFLWIFTKVTGGTTGIVLYSRILYVGILVICAWLTYHVFKKYLDKRNAFFLSYVIVFFEFYSLFYLWYDSTALIFLLLGDLAIVKALDQCDTDKQRYCYLFLAGIAHCCMVIAYFAFIPMALGIAALIAFSAYKHYGRSMHSALKYVCAYAIGAVLIVVTLVIYLQVTVGIGNAFEVIGLITSDRGANAVNFWTLGWEIVKSYVRVNPSFVVITVLLLGCYRKVKKEAKWFGVLVAGIVVLPIVNQFLLPVSTIRGLPNYLSYIALWCIPLYFLIEKKEPIDRCLFYIFNIPVFFSAFLIPYVSLYGELGPTKSWQMCLPGALVSLYYIVRIWKETYHKKIERCNVVFMVVIATLILNSYTYNFLNEPLIEASDARMTEGIYWGIKVNPKMECMAEIEMWVNQYTEGCETILASKEIRSIYLMTDLKPCVRSTERATFEEEGMLTWAKSLEYFEYFGELPDLMILNVTDFSDPAIGNLLLENYTVLDNREIGEYHIFIYRKNVEK